PHQVFAVAMLGGLGALLGLIATAALGMGLYTAIDRLFEWRKRRCDQRQQRELLTALDTCRAIDALPAHDPRKPR
ncbi:hypothetical protein ACKI1S_47325, partial [Streptomyces galilaeus]